MTEPITKRYRIADRDADITGSIVSLRDRPTHEGLPVMVASTLHHLANDPAMAIYLLQAATYAVAAKLTFKHEGRALALVYLTSCLLHGTLCVCHMASLE